MSMQDLASAGPYTIVLHPREPLVARDGRPFSADPGARARTLEWPLPQTIAGAIRTHIGDTLGFDWGGDGPAQARRIAVHGPLLAARDASGGPWTVYLPAPRDALVLDAAEGGERCVALRPRPPDAAGGGTDLPTGLRPLAVETDVKPDPSGAYWSLLDVEEWLAGPGAGSAPGRTLAHLPREARVHVRIDHRRQAADEGALFSTEGLAFTDEPMSADPAAGRDGAPARALLCQIGAAPAGWAPRPALFAMGGERRLTRLEPAAVPWPAMSERLQAGLTGSPRLRLLLATPALFGTAGWRPDWIDPRSWRGSPPGVSRVTLQLVSAAVGRRIPVSGWDLVTGRPKAVRYAVPSGSVYFFEVVDGELTADDVDRLWLQPIGVDEQAGRDGFGLVVPGIW